MKPVETLGDLRRVVNQKKSDAKHWLLGNTVTQYASFIYKRG